jgi:hypothetical protein
VLQKLKVLLEQAERESAKAPAAVATPDLSVNHRSESTAKPTDNGRVPALAFSPDGPVKLSSGERRILTALAQYLQGRSKVQVAVLTGYAATGGGSNRILPRLPLTLKCTTP